MAAGAARELVRDERGAHVRRGGLCAPRDRAGRGSSCKVDPGQATAGALLPQILLVLTAKPGVDVAAQLTPEGPEEASGRRRESAPRDGGCKRGRASRLRVARGLRGWTLPGCC